MLEVLDTAGQEEYTALRDQWIRDGEGFVLVYSITSRSSFSRIEEFSKLIKRVKESVSSGSPTGATYLSSSLNAPVTTSDGPVPIMLVGNKSDKAVERAVSSQEGFALAKRLGCEFVEASAKNCINVEKAYYDVVRLLRQQRQANSNSSHQSSRPSDRRGTAFGSGGSSRDNGDSKRPFRNERRRFKCQIL